MYLACASQKVLRLSPEGDCCAYAYVQHVNNPEALFDATVLRVDDLEVTKSMHEAAVEEYRAEHEYDPDVLDIWGHRINTTRGTCVFDCRTSHNGYYSGSFTASLVGVVPVGASLLVER